jgi:uroporphyrinogen-III synthase
MRVLVTRPAAQAQEWLDRLGAEGIEAVALPLIGIAPADDPAPLRQAWASLHERRLVMFVSPNAAEHFFAARPAGLAWPEDALAASPGPATTRALRTLGVRAERIAAPADDAPQFDSEALWQTLRGHDWRGASVLFVRGESGRDWLAERFAESGARVERLAAYRRTEPVLDASARRVLDEALRMPHEHLWWFSSSEAIDHLEALATETRWSHARALATHPRIAARARRLGFGRVDEVRPAVREVIDALRRSIQSRAP